MGSPAWVSLLVCISMAIRFPDTPDVVVIILCFILVDECPDDPRAFRTLPNRSHSPPTPALIVVP